MQENFSGQDYYDNYDYQLDAQEKSAFIKSLAAIIMAWFPITSIIAVFLGLKAGKLAKQTEELANQVGAKFSGKIKAAKILGMIGWIAGLVCSIVWGIVALIILCYIAVIVVAITSI